MVSGHRGIVRAALSAAGLIIFTALLLTGCDSKVEMNTATAFSIEYLPADIQADYQFISTQQGLAEHIPCYCGCGRTLKHRNLKDCFFTPQGGYERHAAGCLVCQREAREVKDLLTRGLDAHSIRATIDLDFRAFGPPTDTPEVLP